MEEKLKKIRAFASDVDGVLTDGSLICTTEGDLLRQYNAKDGFGLRMAYMNGYGLAIITGGWSQTIVKRLVSSGVKEEDFYLRSRDKVADFYAYCSRKGYRPEEVMYFGDDLPDIPVMQVAGVSVCPADAVEEVKAVADCVSDREGGNGCVREYVEKVMKLRGDWVFDVGCYKKEF